MRSTCHSGQYISSLLAGCFLALAQLVNCSTKPAQLFLIYVLLVILTAFFNSPSTVPVTQKGLWSLIISCHV